MRNCDFQMNHGEMGGVGWRWSAPAQLGKKTLNRTLEHTVLCRVGVKETETVIWMKSRCGLKHCYPAANALPNEELICVIAAENVLQ